MSHQLLHHTKKKYNTLYQRVAKAIENGKFATYTKAKRKALQERLYRYEHRLKNWGVAVVSVATLFGAPIAAKGQITFTQQTGSSNPLNGVDVGRYSAPSFADIDGDGDLDAFIGENDGRIRYYQNTGSSVSPSFVEQTGNSNPLRSVDVENFATPSFADLDGDGDLDAFIGEYYGNIIYYQNTGGSASPSFLIQIGSSNPFSRVNVLYLAAPSFADLDGDGDLDAFIGEYYGTIKYFQNTGSSTSPSFVEQTGSSNPFNGVDVESNSTPSFADLDSDGDLDAFIGENDGNINYYQNTGSSASPSFLVQTGSSNPFNGVDVGIRSTPSFADLDGDSDLDASIGEFNGTIKYYQNTSPIVPVELTTFTGKATQAGNQLFWQTASELNNKGFSIERSEDAKSWKTLGFVAGNGTTLEAQHYTFLDEQPAVGVSYYRLQQLDFDGQYEYSDIISLNYKAESAKDELQVHPNPASGLLQIALQQVNAKLQLYNAQGSLVKEVIAADKNFTINIADLASGIYLLKAQAGEQMWMQQIVVE